MFIRTRTGLQLTAQGRALHDLADRWATLEDALAERLAGMGRLESGRLRVVANAPRPALDLIARFTAAWPGVEVRFELPDWTSAMAALKGRKADPGLITEPGPLPGWDPREIAPGDPAPDGWRRLCRHALHGGR